MEPLEEDIKRFAEEETRCVFLKKNNDFNTKKTFLLCVAARAFIFNIFCPSG